MVIHKYYYSYCNSTGMEYTESEGIHAVGKCLRYAFRNIKLRGHCQILQLNLYCNGTWYGIHRYYQWQEKVYALALDLTVVAQYIILRERG